MDEQEDQVEEKPQRAVGNTLPSSIATTLHTDLVTLIMGGIFRSAKLRVPAKMQ